MEIHAELTEREARVAAVWRENGRLASTIWAYLLWVRRFELAVRGGDFTELDLTLAGAERFAEHYSERRGTVRSDAVHGARTALRAWSHGLRSAGYPAPEWGERQERRQQEPVPALLLEYAAFRRQHRGVSEATIRRDQVLLVEFLAFAENRGHGLGDLPIGAVDDFVTAAAGRLSKKTVCGLCSGLRSFFRYLHGKGLIAIDLASAVAAPRLVARDRPPRALVWGDVQRLLEAVDVNRSTGRRDYAWLLMMAVYGMGAAEILCLTLGDVDWRGTKIQAYRPKTGVRYLLPLLPAVGQALSAYLGDGRPRHAATRRIFVAAVAPHGPLSSSAMRFAIRHYAQLAGITMTPLGSHVLRHSHASRQIEIGTAVHTVGDILGHRDPSSTSHYVRVATERLRGIALSVPRC